MAEPAFIMPTEGPLVPFNGAVPPAPAWFERITAVAPENCFVTVEGARIHYLRWGDKKRPGLLLVKRAAWREDGGWWLASDNPAAGAVDSARFGPVPAEKIVARVLLRYWPVRRNRKLP